MQNTMTRSVPGLFGGLYAWAVTVFLGAILLDVIYARSGLNSADFSEGADFLLLLGALTLLAGLAAIASAWPARNLFIASFVLLIAIEFLTPLLFSSLIQNAQNTSGVNFGPWIRLAGVALPSLLAFLGLGKLHRARG